MLTPEGARWSAHPRSLAGGGGTWDWGLPASLPAELADSSRPGQARRGGALRAPSGRSGPEKRALATAQSGCTSHGDRTARISACLTPSTFPRGRRLRRPAGGGAARDTWPGPRAASGRQEEGRGGASQGLAAEAPDGPERGFCGPAPAPAL